MKSREFCYWLQGYFELAAGGSVGNVLTAHQVNVIKNHLNMVFIHEIDPSFPPKQQAALDRAHAVPISEIKMRC